MIQPEGLQQGWSDSSPSGQSVLLRTVKGPNGVSRTFGQLNSSYSTIHLKTQFAKVRPFSQSKGNKYLGLNFLPFNSAVSTFKKIPSVVTVSTPN